MFKRTKVSVGVLLAIGGAVAATSMPTYAQNAQRVEVTGSRIKRVDAEGALPVTTITRQELEATGVTTVAEFVRTLPFAQAGNFRPQSGSSAAGYASAQRIETAADLAQILPGLIATPGPHFIDLAIAAPPKFAHRTPQPEFPDLQFQRMGAEAAKMMEALGTTR